MPPEFDMKKVTTPLLRRMLGNELRFPRLFLLRGKLALGRPENMAAQMSESSFMTTACTCQIAGSQ